MVDISQMTFLNAFSRIKICELFLIFNWHIYTSLGLNDLNNDCYNIMNCNGDDWYIA